MCCDPFHDKVTYYHIYVYILCKRYQCVFADNATVWRFCAGGTSTAACAESHAQGGCLSEPLREIIPAVWFANLEWNTAISMAGVRTDELFVRGRDLRSCDARSR